MTPFALVGGERYALIAPTQMSNTVIISPHTGHPWAWIERNAAVKWWPEMIPAAGEQPYPYPEIVPGSLFTYGSTFVLAELPRALLVRELEMLRVWTSSPKSWYNGVTIEDTSMTATLLQEIAALRAKVADGTITDDELRRALRIMREERMTAVARAATRKAIDPDAALAAFAE